MKAMLYADWMNFRQSFRSLLFVLVVFAATAFAMNGPMFFNFIVVFLSVMVPTTLFAADQAYGWNRLSLSLPILRRDVVASKFLMGLFINLALVAVSAALTVVYARVTPDVSLFENLSAILTCEGIAMLMMGVLLALSFKFGIEKARYIIMACVWVPVLGVFLLEKLPFFETALHAAGNWLNRAGEGQLVLLIAAVCAAGAAVYAVCWGISVKIYQKAEL